MKYAVIGGGRSIGQLITLDLINSINKGDELLLIDSDFSAIDKLKEAFTEKVQTVKADLNNQSELLKALSGSDILINSLQYKFNLQLMKTALKAGSNYLDVGGLFHTSKKQLELHSEFKKAGKIAILGIAASPGISNLMIQQAAESLEQVCEIHIRVASKDKTTYYIKPLMGGFSSFKQVLEEFSYEPVIISKGKLKYCKPLSGQEPYRFPLPIGIQKPVYLLHSELATIPAMYKKMGLKEMSYKIALNEDFLEKIRFLIEFGLTSDNPIEVNGVMVAPVDLVNQLVNQQNLFNHNIEIKQTSVIRTIIRGIKKSKKVTLISDCISKGNKKWKVGADISNGAAPSVAAQMIASGLISEKGVYAPEKVIPAELFIEELKKREILFKVQKKDGWSYEI